MTIDIEELRKDMEAGTQGDWTLKLGDPDEWPNNDETYGSEWEIIADGNEFAFMGYAPFYPWQSDNIADARRIAHLPELEREYLALREAADALADALDEALSELQECSVEISGEDYNCPSHNEALAAYRKATK